MQTAGAIPSYRIEVYIAWGVTHKCCYIDVCYVDPGSVSTRI